MFNEDDEIEYDPTCTCEELDCPHCNRKDFRQLTEDEENAIELIDSKNYIAIGQSSYRSEGEFDANGNPILISNDSFEESIILSIRELLSIKNNVLFFADEDENVYEVTIEDEE